MRQQRRRRHAISANSAPRPPPRSRTPDGDIGCFTARDSLFSAPTRRGRTAGPRTPAPAAAARAARPHGPRSSPRCTGSSRSRTSSPSLSGVTSLSRLTRFVPNSCEAWVGSRPGEVGVAEDRHPVVGDHLGVGHRACDVAAVGGGHVDDHRAGLHRGHHRPVIIRGAGRPGINAVVMMMSTSWPARRTARALASVVVAHLLGVAVGRTLRPRVDVDAQELPPQRLHLVGHLGARVGRAHDRTQRPRHADRGQPCHPGTHHQHLRRRHLARRGHLAGEEAARTRAPPRPPRGSPRYSPSTTARPATVPARCAAPHPSPEL